METIGVNWDNFVKKSKGKKPAPDILLQKAESEFYRLLSVFDNNERPTTLAAEVCFQYPKHDVASFLDSHVREALSQ
ncbi:MAG: hypothetical protein WC022_02480 [Parcubacteria group bacterium]